MNQEPDRKAIPPPETTALSTGIELEFVEQGDPRGPVLILLHGFLQSWKTWELTLSSISPSYHVFALTQRGHGASGKPDDGYRPADFVRDVVAFMDALEIARATLVGHSMGSYIAQLVAAEYPERVDRLVLIGWGPSRPATPAAAARVQDLNAYVQSLEETIDPTYVRNFVTSTIINAPPAPVLDMLVAESLKVPLAVWKHMLASRLAGDQPMRPPACDAMTLALYGDHDPYIEEGKELLTAALSHVRFITYPDTGHSLHWEQPQRFVADLHTFIESS